MHAKLRHIAYGIVEPGVGNAAAASLFNRLSIIAILVSIGCVVVSTMPTLTASLRADLAEVLHITGAYFLFEYALRLWAAAEHPLFSRSGPWFGTLKYALTPLMAIDALGLVPLVLAVVTPDAHAAIMMFQILRFFRLARYSPALATVGRVLAAEWRNLMAAGLVGLGMLLISATAMYLLENAAQPEKFASIPDAMYWAMVTLATVGYGDVVPITPAGKAVAGFVIIAGLVFFALPVAIIATSFLAEMRRRDFIINYGMVARVPLFSSLDAGAVSELASMLKARKVPRDAVIIREGDTGESMFFIAQGLVEVVVPGGPISLRDGDFFGEIAILGKVRRTATVVAKRPCELLVLDATDLNKLMEQNPQVETALRDVIAARKAINKKD